MSSRSTTRGALTALALLAALGVDVSDARAEDGARVASTVVAPAGPEVSSWVTRPRHFGLYAGSDVRVTSIAQTNAMLLGMQAGWILDGLFVIGASGYALASDVPSPGYLPAGTGTMLSFGYGGGRFAAVPNSSRPLHLVMGLLVGGGAVNATGADHAHTTRGFLVVEPDVAFEINVAEPVRVALGGAYRISGGTSLAGLGPAGLGGPSGFLVVKVGEFR